MRTIFKYEVNVGSNTVRMPKNADILTAQVQDGFLKVWAIVESAAQPEDRHIYVMGTGYELLPDMGRSEYVATVQDGPFVWHVFAHKARSVLRKL